MQVLDRRVFERPRKVMLDSEITDAVIDAHRAGTAARAATVDVRGDALPALRGAAPPTVPTTAPDAAVAAPDARVDVRV